MRRGWLVFLTATGPSSPALRPCEEAACWGLSIGGRLHCGGGEGAALCRCAEPGTREALICGEGRGQMKWAGPVEKKEELFGRGRAQRRKKAGKGRGQGDGAGPLGRGRS